jgi:hypothetical protein
MLGSGSNYSGIRTTQPIIFQAEYGWYDDFFKKGWTLGNSITIGTGKFYYYSRYGSQVHTVSSCLNLHFPVFKNFDTYAGLGMGIGIVPSELAFGFFLANVGARYSFSGPWNVAVEAGYGRSWFNLGVGYKM